MREQIKDIGIVAFNGIERLDIEGPLGVLGWTSKVSGDQFDIRLLSMDGGPVRDHLFNGLIAVDGSTKQATGFDLLLVPGGNLSQFVQDKELVDEIRRLGSSSRILASVCTGAFLVAQTGLADGKRMATHWRFRELFRQQFPRIKLVDQRYANDGTLWSSAGITAGIDMALRLVISNWGEVVAHKVQDFLEFYPEPPFGLGAASK